MKNYTIRMPDDLREKLQFFADCECRSLSNYIIHILIKEVERIESEVERINREAGA